MEIISKCLNYFQKIDIDFDIYIVADTQEKTAKMNNYIYHADESEFFSRREFAEIASAIFIVFGFAKVFYSELEFIEYVLEKRPLLNECYVYNFSRDGIAEGKKSLIPAFCDLCNLRYTGSNAFTISLLRNKWFFSQIVANWGILTPKSILYPNILSAIKQSFAGETILIKNIYESASQGLLSDNRIHINNISSKKIDAIMKRMNVNKVLIQQYISGPECEVLVLQFNKKYYALEPIEIIIKGNDFLDSDISNAYNYSFRKLSEQYDVGIVAQIKQNAINAAYALNIKDYARFDFRIKENQPYLIDIAGTPYTIKHSSVAYLFEEILHLEYNDIYKVIMACCISNYDADSQGLSQSLCKPPN